MFLDIFLSSGTVNLIEETFQICMALTVRQQCCTMYIDLALTDE